MKSQVLLYLINAIGIKLRKVWRLEIASFRWRNFCPGCSETLEILQKIEILFWITIIDCHTFSVTEPSVLKMIFKLLPLLIN